MAATQALSPGMRSMIRFTERPVLVAAGEPANQVSQGYNAKFPKGFGSLFPDAFDHAYICREFRQETFPSSHKQIFLYHIIPPAEKQGWSCMLPFYISRDEEYFANFTLC